MTCRAAVPMTYFGVPYDAGDEIDISGWSTSSVVRLMRHAPVYFEGAGASEQSWIQVGKFGQGPVTVGAGLDHVSFIAALIGVDGIYGTSAEDESSLPVGWALVDDGSGGLNDVTVPAGVYLVRVVTTWDTSHTDGYRTLRVAAATSGGFDIRKGDDPILSTGQWYVDAISAVSADGGSLLGHSFDTKITADNSSADDVSVTFVEIDIYKIA